MYSGLYMKIPTSHGMWAIVKDRYSWPATRFLCRDKMQHFFWTPVPDNEVPKSVRRKARCFFANPTLFGKKGSL